MKTINDIFNEFITSLNKIYDLSEAEKITILSFEHVLNYRRIDISLYKNQEVESEKINMFENILRALISGRPVQYVLGHSWFYGLDLVVNKSVLIPRRETEELVDWIVKDIKNSTGKVNTILDICTGSGCVALALKKEFPGIKIIAIDNSEEALEVAKINSINKDLPIGFIKMDALKMDLDIIPDVIVSNPPYVLLSEIEKMHTRVTEHEPFSAIFVEGNDALIFYRKISEWAKSHLSKGGKIYYEVNEMMGKEILELHSQEGFKDVTLMKDLQGKDRMFRLIKTE